MPEPQDSRSPDLIPCHERLAWAFSQDVDANAQHVLLAIVYRAVRGFHSVGIPQIIADTGRSDRGIRIVLKRLEDAKLIERKRRPSIDGRGRSTDVITLDFQAANAAGRTDDQAAKNDRPSGKNCSDQAANAAGIGRNPEGSKGGNSLNSVQTEKSQREKARDFSSENGDDVNGGVPDEYVERAFHTIRRNVSERTGVPHFEGPTERSAAPVRSLLERLGCFYPESLEGVVPTFRSVCEFLKADKYWSSRTASIATFCSHFAEVAAAAKATERKDGWTPPIRGRSYDPEHNIVHIPGSRAGTYARWDGYGLTGCASSQRMSSDSSSGPSSSQTQLSGHRGPGQGPRFGG